ncbi:MAG TPA: DUF4190 domain-containing protein [Amycolatopsis sp.]|nr:DUF4190 domain-containing protein [Amycolatopsis sp.]
MFDDRGSGLADRADSVEPVDPDSTNGFAIASLVFGLLGVVPLGVVFSIVAMVRINRTQQSGRGLALAGLILSTAWLVAGIVGAVLYLGFVFPQEAARQGTIDQPPIRQQTERPLPGSVFSLASGDCFSGADEAGFHATRTDCDVLHDGQVFLKDSLSAYQHYPGPQAEGTADQECRNEALNFFGSAIPPQTLKPQLYFPSEVAWRQGARSYVCAFVQRDGGQLTGPVRP